METNNNQVSQPAVQSGSVDYAAALRQYNKYGRVDKWMYLFKNMAKLNARPVSFQEKIFDRLFDKAKIANLAPNEYRAYQKSENMGYSYQNTIDYAREEGEKIGEKRGREIGRAEGKAEGKAEEKTAIARNMLTKGYDLQTVSELTGLSIGELRNIRS